jgi:hypothetical protein
MSGWIKLHRQIRDHWLWSDSDKLKMWLDIILEVNHAPAKIVMGYNLVECERGQTVRSLQGWAERWNISKDSARHFLMLLQKDNMIVLENMKFTTRITVCNYDTYNATTHDEQTEAKRKPNGDQTGADPNKKNKEGKEGKEINIPFDVFWNLYDKKVGDKSKCENKWKNLTDPEREKVIQTLPGFIAGIRDKQYQPYPQTYLNNKRWEDEISTKPKFMMP